MKLLWGRSCNWARLAYPFYISIIEVRAHHHADHLCEFISGDEIILVYVIHLERNYFVRRESHIEFWLQGPHVE